MTSKDGHQAFTDLLNTEVVQAGAANPDHWVNQPVEDGASLLELAVREGRPREAAVLVKVGALVDRVGLHSGLTPLHVAVEKGDLEMLKLLLHDR
jgi:ankyrin repeat protein